MALFDRHPLYALAVAVGGRADTDSFATSVVCVENDVVDGARSRQRAALG
jgi:hypothetical protein